MIIPHDILCAVGGDYARAASRRERMLLDIERQRILLGKNTVSSDAIIEAMERPDHVSLTHDEIRALLGEE